MKGDEYFGRVRELLVGIDAKNYLNSLKWHEPEAFEVIYKQAFPNATSKQIEGAYVEYIRGYMAVRNLQVFGRTRDEIINNFGKIIEENPRLKAEYSAIIYEMARKYNPSKEPSIAEILEVEVPKKEVTLEEKVKKIDARLLRIMLQRRA